MIRTFYTLKGRKALEETRKKPHCSKNYLSINWLFPQTNIGWMRWQRRRHFTSWSDIVHTWFQLRLQQVAFNTVLRDQVGIWGPECRGILEVTEYPPTHTPRISSTAPRTQELGEPLLAVLGSRIRSHMALWCLSEQSNSEGHGTSAGPACAWRLWLCFCLVALLWANHCLPQTLVFSQAKQR